MVLKPLRIAFAPLIIEVAQEDGFISGRRSSAFTAGNMTWA